MIVEPLTWRQKGILDFIREELARNGVAPSLQEIATRFQLRSLSTVHVHLKNLASKGHLTRRWNYARSITLRVHEGCCPMCGQTMPTKEAQHGA